MKRTVVALLLFVSIICAAQPTQFDKYNPLLWIPPHYTPIDNWKPTEYSPLVSNDPVTMAPFKPLTVPPSIDEMKEFIKITNANPSLKDQYDLPYSRYIDITAKAIYSSHYPRWKKKELSAFYHDYNIAKKRVYQQDSVQFTIRRKQFIRDSLVQRKTFLDASIASRNKYIKDSLAFRDKFFQDSLKRRTLFLVDSIKNRESFVEDSLYRADYRIKNNYDYVEWSGSHGEPLNCYKNGTRVSWKILDEKGRVVKEYKHNELIHDYHYYIDFGYYYVDDKNERRKEQYKDEEMTLLKSVEWYNQEGRTVKKQYDDGDVYSYTYYSDGEQKSETVSNSSGIVSIWEKKRLNGGKTMTVFTKYVINRDDLFEYSDYPYRQVIDYYSDGTQSERWLYNSFNAGKSWIIREYTDYRGTYEITKYYDKNGQYERTEVSY